MKKADRVGVILGSNKGGSIDFFGYGIYDGEEIPLEAVGQIAEIMKEHSMKGPKLKLDNGEIVYGCESWWGSEEKTKEILKDKIVNHVSITKIREEYNQIIGKDKENAKV